jgi:hypothetical protein
MKKMRIGQDMLILLNRVNRSCRSPRNMLFLALGLVERLIRPCPQGSAECVWLAIHIDMPTPMMGTLTNPPQEASVVIQSAAIL